MFIYKIYSESGDKVYIGSTRKKYLCNRWADHRSKYRVKKGGHCASYELFDEYGMDNCKIQELEICDDNQRYERERYWILATPNCINLKKNTYLTKEEKKQYHSQWFKEWKSEDCERYKKRNHDSYLKQKSKMLAKVMCECGIEYSQNHHKRHQVSLRHQNLMKNNILFKIDD